VSTYNFEKHFLVYYLKKVYNVIVDLEVNLKMLEKIMKNIRAFRTIAILIVLLAAVNIHLIYSISLLTGIETVLRIVGSIVIILIWLLFAWLAIKVLIKNKKKNYIFFLTGISIYIIISFVIYLNFNKVYSKLSNISNNHTMYSTSLITDHENSVSSIGKIGDSKIGILSDEKSIDGYQIAKDIIKEKKLKNEVVYFDSYASLIEALDKGEVLYIFLPTNYKIMFQSIETIKPILDKTKVIYTKEKMIERKISNRGKSIDKPFTMLLMGVDSEAENISSGTFNGDALMVLTFNPKTLKTTIVSIPRDSYVPIACFNNQRKNKITHAAWYGEDCMTKTIENFLDVTIDYYFKINFKGVVKLVDALGGVEVDVPYSFCEQDSNRRWGKNTIYLKKGLKTLNGEEALALSRNRNDNSNICGSAWGNAGTNDFVRGQNQQLVIKGILNKLKNLKSIDMIYDLLDVVSLNMETNMQTSEILSFYNIGKDVLDKTKAMKVEEVLGFQRLYISGYSEHIMDYSAFDNQGMRMNLYNFIPYKGSVRDITNAMKINLGEKEAKVIKTLSFDINEPYTENVVGKGNYNESRLSLLPNFIGSSEATVDTYAKKHGFKVVKNYITSSNPSHTVGSVTAQTPYANMDISYVRDIKVDIVEILNIVETPQTIPDCSMEENKEHSLCILPNFVGGDYVAFKNWLKKYKISILVDEVQVKEDDPDYSKSQIGKVIYQSKNPGTSLYDLIDKSLQIKFIEEIVVQQEPTGPVEEIPGGPVAEEEKPVETDTTLEKPELNQNLETENTTQSLE